MVERGNNIIKWKRCETRLLNLEYNDRMGQIPLPPRNRCNLRNPWMAGEFPDDSEPINLELGDEEIAFPDEVGVDDAPIRKKRQYG